MKRKSMNLYIKLLLNKKSAMILHMCSSTFQYTIQIISSMKLVLGSSRQPYAMLILQYY